MRQLVSFQAVLSALRRNARQQFNDYSVTRSMRKSGVRVADILEVREDGATLKVHSTEVRWLLNARNHALRKTAPSCLQSEALSGTCELARTLRSPMGSKGDLTALKYDFRYTPEGGLKSDIAACRFRAMYGPLGRSTMGR